MRLRSASRDAAAHDESDAPRARQGDARAHPRRGRATHRASAARTASAWTCSRRKPASRARPCTSTSARSAPCSTSSRRRRRARSRSSTHRRHIGDPLTALRDMLGAVCRHWDEREDAVRELRTLVAVTGADAPTDGVDPEYLALRRRRPRGGRAPAAALVARRRGRRARAAHVVPDLRAAARRSTSARPAQIEALLAKLAVSIVAPNAG